jgi:uncharacterized membrane protein
MQKNLDKKRNEECLVTFQGLSLYSFKRRATSGITSHQQKALALLNQWIAAFLQFVTSTGLIALFEFWYKALWRKIQTTTKT